MNRRPNRRTLSRVTLTVETLESRRLLAADLMVFQNPIQPLDVNLDQYVSPVDALAIINELNTPRAEQTKVGDLLDTTGDALLAPNDALAIINDLNAGTGPTDINHLLRTRDYLLQESDSLPAAAKPVADEFNDLMDDYETARQAIYASLQSFREYSVQNHIELTNRHNELERVHLVNHDALQRGLLHIGEQVGDVSVTVFGNSPDIDQDDKGTPYEFNPDDYTDPAIALPELFEELEQGIDEVEIPTYGDVIDNYEDLYQTYEDSDYEIDVYVTEEIDVSEYEDFVLHGGDLQELLNLLEQGAEQLPTDLDDLVEDQFGPALDLSGLFEDITEGAYLGELIYNDVAAIGGETTGSVIVMSGDSVVELDFGDSTRLNELAEMYDNQVVIIEGTPNLIPGVEIPDRTVIEVRCIFGEVELESLTNVLSTLDPSDSLDLLTTLDNLNLG